MKKIIFFAMLSWSGLAWAWTEADIEARIRKGGDVIVCNNKTAFLLEYYEASVSHNNPQNFDNARTYEESLDVLVRRLATYFPEEAIEIKKYISRFREDVAFVEGADLVGESPDHDLSLEVGCHIKKVVMVRQKKFPEDRLFYIQKDYWNLLEPGAQAGLTLQAIFALLYPYYDLNIRAIRDFNAALAGARSFPQLNTPFAWAQFFHSINFPCRVSYRYQGVYEIDWSPQTPDYGHPSFWPNGQFKNVHYAGFASHKKFKFLGHTVDFGPRSNLEFDEEGNLIAFGTSSRTDLKALGIPYTSNEVRHVYADPYSRTYYGYSFYNSDVIRYKMHGVRCSEVNGLEFYISGEVRRIYCRKPMSLKWNGKRLKVKHVQFSKQGTIEAAWEYTR